jgi:hypothetical protein
MFMQISRKYKLQKTLRDFSMNAEFYINLTKSKTLKNAAFIEGIKDIYLKSEQKAQFESVGKVTDDRGEVFFENGSVRCTKVSDGIIVEASSTGTRNMYGVVGVVNHATSLEEAVRLGKSALDNDAVMEGIWDSMKRGIATAALSIAPFLVGCAGGQAPSVGTPAETQVLDQSKIPEMVQAFADKIREEAEQNEDFSVKHTPSADEAEHIYNMLLSGELKVNSEGDENAQREAAKRAADAFARGLRVDLLKKGSLPGADDLFKPDTVSATDAPASEEVN